MSILKMINTFRIKILILSKWRKYKIAVGFHCGLRVRLWAKNQLILGRNFYIGRDSQIETD